MNTKHSVSLFLSVILVCAMVGCSQPSQTPNPTLGIVASTPPPTQTVQVVHQGFGIPADGDVIAMPLYQSLQYLNAIRQGCSGTFIMQSANNDLLLAAPINSGSWFWMALSGNGKPIADLTQLPGGQYANTMSFSDLIKSLEQNDWVRAFPSDLPVWFVGTITSVNAFLQTFGSLLASPMFIITPGDGHMPDPRWWNTNQKD